MQQSITSSTPTIVPSHNHELRIAVTGKMRTGKDTVTKAISDYLTQAGYEVNQHSFGSSLKRVAYDLFPEEFNNDEKPRDLFQWIGQTLRQRNENVWVNQVNNDISNINEQVNDSDVTHVAHIINDLRQPNEYEYCKLNNFIIIKVTCDDEVRVERMNQLNDNFNLDNLQHETEKYIDHFSTDYTLDTTYLKEKRTNEVMQAFIKTLLKRKQYKGE